MHLSASAGLHAITAAIRSASDAKLSGAWALTFSASSSGVPGKVDVTASPPVSLSVSLSTPEQRIGVAKAIAKALCPDGMLALPDLGGLLVLAQFGFVRS